MNKNKKTGGASGLIVRLATQFLLTTGVLATAHAADATPEPQEPQVTAQEAVDVEVFRGVRILSGPTSNVYPVGEVRDGREGWVQLNMMIEPKGKPYEVMVVDSSGNPAFEKAAVKSLNQIAYEPARRGNSPIDSSLTLKMKFAIRDLAKGASREFVTAYRQFAGAVEAADKDKADVQLARMRPQNLVDSRGNAECDHQSQQDPARNGQ
jgi:TonB family protein